MQIWQGAKDGWPYIEWVEEFPTGKTEYDRQQSDTFRFSLIVFLVVAVVVYLGSGDLSIALGVGFFAHMLGFVGGKPFEGMTLPGTGVTTAVITPPISDEYRRREALAKATPIMALRLVRASVARDPNGIGLAACRTDLWGARDSSLLGCNGEQRSYRVRPQAALRANIRFIFQAKVTSAHSALTFSRTEGEKRPTPRARVANRAAR